MKSSHLQCFTGVLVLPVWLWRNKYLMCVGVRGGWVFIKTHTPVFSPSVPGITPHRRAHILWQTLCPPPPPPPSPPLAVGSLSLRSEFTRNQYLPPCCLSLPETNTFLHVQCENRSSFFFVSVFQGIEEIKDKVPFPEIRETCLRARVTFMSWLLDSR